MHAGRGALTTKAKVRRVHDVRADSGRRSLCFSVETNQFGVDGGCVWCVDPAGTAAEGAEACT